MTLPPSVLQQPVALGDLLDQSSFGEVCQSFAELYRVGLKVFDAAGNKLVDVKVGNADFCGYIFSKPEGRTRCMELVARVKGEALPEEPAPLAMGCFSGCRYLVRPVLHEGDVVGRIVFGPFVPDDVKALPEALVRLAPDFDAALAARYLEKVRRVGAGAADKIVQHFAEIVDVLVYTGHKHHLTAKLHIEAVQESYRELQAKNRQIEEAFARLQELDRLKSNFIATMSHELRTPLTSVIGYSEMMLEGLGGPITAEQREYLGIVMEKGENLLQLITSILDVSKIEAGRVRLVLGDVELGQLLRDVVQTMLPQARKKGVQLALHAGPLPHVECDRDKMRQSLLNLLANAVKFTAAGGSIEVRAQAAGDRVAVSVKDTGIGIPEQHLARVFDVFYQVDNTSTREFGGTGLGLAIAKSFVEAHGGEVQVRSAPGEGSTFTVVLPTRPPPAALSPTGASPADRGAAAALGG